MNILIMLLCFAFLVAAVAGAYYFGKFLEESCGINSVLVIGVAMVAMGVFIYWLLATEGVDFLGNIFGWHNTPYKP